MSSEKNSLSTIWIVLKGDKITYPSGLMNLMQISICCTPDAYILQHGNMNNMSLFWSLLALPKKFSKVKKAHCDVLSKLRGGQSLYLVDKCKILAWQWPHFDSHKIGIIETTEEKKLFKYFWDCYCAHSDRKIPNFPSVWAALNIKLDQWSRRKLWDFCMCGLYVGVCLITTWQSMFDWSNWLFCL